MPILAPAAAISTDLAAIIESQGLSAFQAEMLADSLASLPPIVPGQHALDDAPSVAAFDNFLAVEDILSSCGVFTNGFTKAKCSAASCACVFGFQQFDAAMAVIGIDRFCRGDWVRLVGYYRHNWNLSPIMGLLAAAFARKAKLPDPLTKDEATTTFYAGRE